MEKLSLLIKEFADKIDLYYIPYYGEFCILTLQNRMNKIKIVPFSGKGTYWTGLPEQYFKVEQEDFHYLKKIYIEALLEYILKDEFSFDLTLPTTLYIPDRLDFESYDDYLARTGIWNDNSNSYGSIPELPEKEDFFKIEQNIIDYLLPQLNNILVWRK